MRRAKSTSESRRSGSGSDTDGTSAASSSSSGKRKKKAGWKSLALNVPKMKKGRTKSADYTSEAEAKRLGVGKKGSGVSQTPTPKKKSSTSSAGKKKKKGSISKKKSGAGAAKGSDSTSSSLSKASSKASKARSPEVSPRAVVPGSRVTTGSIAAITGRARGMSRQEYMASIDTKLDTLRRRQTLRSLDDMKEAPKADSRFYVETSNMESVRVIGRFRPSNETELHLDEDRPSHITDEMSEPVFESQFTVSVDRCKETGASDPYQCTLDFMLPPKLKQHHVLNLIGRPFVEHVLNGFNGTIFAYGQTGSGKSYSMFGPSKRKSDADYGLVPRTVALLFKTLDDKMEEKESSYSGSELKKVIADRTGGGTSAKKKKMKSTDGRLIEYEVTMQCVQLYKDNLMDLIQPDKSGTRKLKIKIDFETDSVYVQHLTKVSVDGVSEFLVELNKSFKNRIVASHKLNAESSRSHMIVMLNVRQKFNGGTVINAKLNFGDLAGSEDVTRALGPKPDPLRLKEAIAINKSLSCLTTVINSLVKGERPSYRQSSLTHMLKDSLGGNAKTTILVNLSPHWSNRSETIRTLRFAETAKKVKNNARVNRAVATSELKKRIHQLEVENDKLRADLSQAQGEIEILKSQERVRGASVSRERGASGSSGAGRRQLSRTSQDKKMLSESLKQGMILEQVGEEDEEPASPKASIDISREPASSVDDESLSLSSDDDFDNPDAPPATVLAQSMSSPVLPTEFEASASIDSGDQVSGLIPKPMPPGLPREPSFVDELLSGEALEMKFQKDILEYLETIDSLRAELDVQQTLVDDKDRQMEELRFQLEEHQRQVGKLEDALEENAQKLESFVCPICENGSKSVFVSGESHSSDAVTPEVTTDDGVRSDSGITGDKQMELPLMSEHLSMSIGSTGGIRHNAEEREMERMEFEQRIKLLEEELERVKTEAQTNEEKLESQLEKLQKKNGMLRSDNQQMKKESTTNKVLIDTLTEESEALKLKIARIERRASSRVSGVIAPSLKGVSEDGGDSAVTESDIDITPKGEDDSKLEPIELLLKRFAGAELNDFGIPQNDRISTVARMVYELNDEIGTLMDKWLPKSSKKSGSSRMKSDKMIYQCRQLIAQFQMASQQLAEYDASHLNNILMENKTNRKELSKLKKELKKSRIEIKEKSDEISSLKQELEQLLTSAGSSLSLSVTDGECTDIEHDASFLTTQTLEFGSIDFRSSKIDMKTLVGGTPTSGPADSSSLKLPSFAPAILGKSATMIELDTED